jgi:putative membrane-bound dehydrogenase-like protein
MRKNYLRQLFQSRQKYLALLALLADYGAFAAEVDLSLFKTHPDVEISLVAQEPNVVSPVALTFDEEGRLFVVEMRDYPYGFGPKHKPGGTIRLLEDLDGDGKFEKSTIFAEGLSFPTSIAPWKGGVLVSAPPSIAYLKDTNGDGKADLRLNLFEGFVLGVTDSNMSGLRWGLDNRVHGDNGGNGGDVRSLKKPTLLVKLGEADYSFDPESGDFARTYQTGGGFGLIFDNWSRSFTPHNVNHMQLRVMPLRYLERNPYLPPREVTVSVSDHGEMSVIYPISTPETRPNHPEQAGHFSSSGAMGYIGFPGFKGDLYESLLVADVVGNIVHRDVLEPNGPIFTAKRSPAEQTSEFIASRERTFRPTAMELGPDGAIYIADMQRDVIEHPDYIPQKLRDKIDLRAGENRGRIYRVTPKGGLPPVKVNLRKLSTYQLTRALGHTNQWMRTHAQRLLVEQRDGFAVNLLEGQLKSLDALTRLHSLWALQGMGALTVDAMATAVHDEQPAIREAAILLIERWPTNVASLWETVAQATKDGNARVRFQAGLSLGALYDTKMNAPLAELYVKDQQYPFTRLAVLSSLRSGAIEVLRQLQERLEPDALRELADLAGSEASHKKRLEDLAPVLAKVTTPLLEGLETGVRRSSGVAEKNSKLVEALGPLTEPAAVQLARTLSLPLSEAQQAALQKSAAVLADHSQPLNARVDAAQLLAFADNPKALLEAIEGAQPAEVQAAAIQSLRAFNDPAVARGLLERWRELTPPARGPVLNLLLQRAAFHDPLLTAIESGKVTLGELNLDLEQRRRLLRRGSPEIRARAAKFIGDEEYSNRKTIVEDWMAKLPASGDAKLGQPIFEKVCAQCHRVGNIGNQVGPDLSSVAHRSVEDLLSNILDPNMAINPAYIAYNAELQNGDSETGILSAQTANAVTLLQAGGKKVTLERARLKKLQSSGASLMPEGLEAALTPADLRNLIAFVQEGVK